MRVLLNDICKNLQNTACATLFDYVYYSNKYGKHWLARIIKNLDSLYLADLINRVCLGEIDDYRQIVPNDQTKPGSVYMTLKQVLLGKNYTVGHT